MKNFGELKKTTNRSIFNKAYKKHLECTGKLRCSRCGYHSGENNDNKWYNENRFPCWKLVSRNEKQWMDEKIKIRKLNK